MVVQVPQVRWNWCISKCALTKVDDRCWAVINYHMVNWNHLISHYYTARTALVITQHGPLGPCAGVYNKNYILYLILIIDNDETWDYLFPKWFSKLVALEKKKYLSKVIIKKKMYGSTWSIGTISPLIITIEFMERDIFIWHKIIIF